MTMRTYILLLTAALGLAACSAKNQEARKLDGRWNIAKSERFRIDPDGSTEQFEDLEDVGYMEFTEGFLENNVVMDYVNFNGDRLSVNTLFLHDDYGERVRFAAVFCNDIFNCDLTWNIDRSGRRVQEWSFYYTNPQGRGQYDLSRHDTHYRWTVRLEKE